MKKTVVVLALVAGLLLLFGTALSESWICENCGTENTGNFCGNCGAKKPAAEPEPVSFAASDEWGCPDCFHLNSTNFCSNCGRTKPAPEEMIRSIAVPEPVYETMDVEGVFVGQTLTIPEETPMIWSGSMSDSHTEDSYTFTAPRNGTYRFDLTDMMASTSMRLRVWDSRDNNVMDTYSGGDYMQMTGGETYRIKVEQHRGSTQYTLRIGVQKPTTDLSAATTVYDQVSFADQKNVYTFTAPISGRYRFDLTEITNGLSFRMLMWDKFEKNILDTYSGNAYIDLEGGETYQFQVRQHQKLGSYVMLVYFQKETRDITGYDTVNDSIQYADQKNIYMFTPPVSGRYRFDLTESNANTSYRLLMWDKYDKNIMDTYSGGDSIALEAGETYQLQVRHHKGNDTYRLRIGCQKASTDISGADAVYDRITYSDQKNVYYFTPAQSGKYEFRIGCIDSTRSFRLLAWDKYQKNILDTYSGKDTLTLEAGDTYEIQVRHHKGFDSYRLTVQPQ